MEIPVVQASSKSVQYRAQTPPRLPMVAALRDCKDCHRAVKGGIRKHSVSTKPGCKPKPVPPAPTCVMASVGHMSPDCWPFKSY